MVEREQVIGFLKQKGPSVPNDMKRGLGGDTMLFGAILSELKGRGLVLITHTKLGTSPFYYLPGQEAQLEKLIGHANPKDQKTIEMLKEKKVVRDQTLELFERVSLRQVKDFAKELQVNTANGKMLFWRYFLVSEEEAIEILKKQYNKPQATVKAEEKSEKELTKDIQEKLPETSKQEHTQTKKADQVETKPVGQQQLQTDVSFEPTVFYEEIQAYFKKTEIVVLSSEQIAKNREYEFIISVPSSVGSMEMYCRARNKKKLNEGDVAPALLKAKTKDLPCIFLTSGKFTKKSLELIEKEYKGLLIKNL